ncbi:MAG: hypothetical protein ACQERK_01660 [Campylobacterota bacterium]
MDFCHKRISECLRELEKEVMDIISNPKTDKARKNILIKPLSAKKKILQNTIDSLALVDKHNTTKEQ